MSHAEHTDGTKRITEGAWGQSQQPLGNFCDFAPKIAISTPF